MTKHICHPGVWIRVHMEAKGLIQKQLTHDLGINPAITSLVLNGKKDINPRLALKLQKVFGVPAITWLMWQASYDLMQEIRKQENG